MESKEPLLPQSTRYETSVYNQMHPILFTLNICGINSQKSFVPFCYESDRRKIAWSIYNAVVLLLVVTTVCRWMGVFQTERAELHVIFDAHTTIWAAECMFHFVFFFVESSVFSHFKTFLRSYQEYVDKYRMGVISVKHFACVCVALYWVFLSMVTVSDTFFDYLYLGNSSQFMWPLDNESDFTMLVAVINRACILYLFAMWFGITLIICFICICLKHEFEYINDEIKELSSRDPECFFQRLEHFRHRHFLVCKLIQNFDTLFSLHLAIDVICTLAEACLILYVLIWDRSIDDGVETSTIALWICMALGKTVVQLFFASLLNEAVSV